MRFFSHTKTQARGNIGRRCRAENFPILAGLGLLLGLLWPAMAGADTLHLKNGKKINGVIEKTSSDAQRVAVNINGARIFVQRDLIDHIEERPKAEVDGDSAIERGDLDAALDCYQKALAELPEDAVLRRKVESVKSQLVERDRRRYGARFDSIEQRLARGEYATALMEARELDKQVEEAATHRRVQIMMSRACVGLAQQARNRFNMQDAEEQYKQAARNAPFYPPAILELARFYDQQAPKRATAILLYKQVLEAARTQADSLPVTALNDTRYRLGQLLFEQGRVEEALQYLMDLIRHNQLANYPPASDMVDQALAKIYADTGAKRTNELVGYLNEIIQRKPGDDQALALLGRIEYERGRIDQAKSIFERIIALDGDNVLLTPRQDAGYYLGLIYRQRSDLEHAVQMLTPIASTSTGHYAALCELGEINLDQALNEQALGRFKMARQLHADRFRASLGMGQALVNLKRYDEGREFLGEVLARDPQNIKALSALAQSFYEEKRFGDVIEHAGKVVQIIETQADDHPTTEQSAKLVSLRTMLGTACIRVNQIFTGRSHFEKVLKLKPDYAPALAGIGESYQLESNYDKAEEYFKKAMAADPKNPQYPLNLALNCHKYRQSPANALPYYKQYYQLGGHDPSVRQWYIEAGGVPEE